MRIRQWLLCFIILIFSTGLAAQVTMAAMDFENNSIFERKKWEPLKSGLAQILISEMHSVESIQFVERRRLKSILDEIKLAQSGLLDERKAADIGRLSGARYMLFGSYLVGLKNQLRIDLRMVNVETGETVKAAQKTGRSKDFLKLMHNLMKEFIKDLSIPISKNEMKRFNKTKSFPIATLLAYSEAVKFEDAGKLKKAGRTYKRIVDMQPKFRPAQIRLQAIVKILRQRQRENH
ncbi:hypothetical protein KAR48_10505 [bacterium]|nr:hypothetical protein [bacterium]